MKKLILGITSALLLTVGPVLAAPSVNGSTGLINSPTADVLRPGQISLGYYHLKDGGVGSFNTNLAPNLELGVAAFRYDGQSNKNYINGKFAIVPETVLTPGLAIGMEDIGNKDQRSAYAVVSKALPFGFRIHAGTGNGRFNGVFAGIEKTINPLSIVTGNNAFPATTLIAEYDGKTMNYGARMSVIPGLKLDAGVRNHDGYIGISFTN
jgi:hypothetical protein